MLVVVRCIVRDMRVCVEVYVYWVLMNTWIDPRERSYVVGSADTCVSWAGDTVVLEAASGIVSAHHSDSD